jgi:anti-sigma28 factor (negative regulator of flagellin synthesis)
MIRGLSAGSVMNAMQINSKSEVKSVQQKDVKDNSRLEAIKNQIDSGEYKINIEETAKRVAQSLM